MAFSKKTWLQRIVQFPGRRILNPTGNANEVDVSRNEGTVTQVGDLLSVANMNDLENRIENAINPVENSLNKIVANSKLFNDLNYANSNSLTYFDSNVLHRPDFFPSDQSGICSTIFFADSFIIQTAYSFWGNNTARRNKINGVWTSWVSLNEAPIIIDSYVTSGVSVYGIPHAYAARSGNIVNITGYFITSVAKSGVILTLPYSRLFPPSVIAIFYDAHDTTYWGGIDTSGNIYLDETIPAGKAFRIMLSYPVN